MNLTAQSELESDRSFLIRIFLELRLKYFSRVGCIRAVTAFLFELLYFSATFKT